MDVPLDQPIFTLWDARNAPLPEDPLWVPAYEIHELGLQAYRDNEGFPRFSDWTSVAVVMSTAEVPTVAIKTSEGPFPLLSFKAIAEVRVTEADVPIRLHAVTNSNGETTQVVEAVAELGDAKCRVSFIKDSEGVTIQSELMEQPRGTPTGAFFFLHAADDISWDRT